MAQDPAASSVRRPEIVDPSPAWAAEFQRIAQDVRCALGVLALRIDHIGSTSVPGLAAKDVIDVQVTVAELDLQLLQAGFTAAGFLHRADNLGIDHRPPGVGGPDSDWQKLFFSPQAGRRRANVHVRVAGKPNQRYPLLFRDYLRTHPAAAAAYAELKRRLAGLGIDTGVYADVKDPACDIIMAAAEEWAALTGWSPGSSDG